ncbi:MAG: hypothetical protein F6J87_12035 [Spirulina sp. SIO3F2]|nr:hypothetical protein [Spirulina sp. SIO3F2]
MLKKIFILSTPLLLGGVEAFHPTSNARETAFEVITQQVNTWIIVHVLQVPLFGMIALVVFLLVKSASGYLSIISKLSIFLFFTFYNALDSISGIASGILVLNSQELPPELRRLAVEYVNLLFTDSLVQIIGLFGACGWLVAVFCTAIYLHLEGNSFLSTVLLAASGVLFAISHAPPTGTIGLGCFFLSMTMIDFSILE